jgi:ABC-type phosphate transport system auxiliary subunit
MPVTAKLSRTFYEKFGDEATNELVEWLNAVNAAYRSDLREFNDINFERFDSKLTERLALSDSRLEKRLAEFEAKIEARLAGFEERFVGLDGRLAQLEQKIETQNLSLRIELAQAKTEMVRWMFGFWVATVGMLFLARLF